MGQKALKNLPETGGRNSENEKMTAFFRSLYKGAMLYSPLFGYMKVKESNDSGIMMTIPNPREEEPSDFLFLYNGRAACFEKGECMLFLSPLYRRWNVLNFQMGDIVAMDIKYKDGHILTYVVIFHDVETINFLHIRTYACLCKDCDVLIKYALLFFHRVCEEEVESIDLRYATPTEEELLNNAVAKKSLRWDKEKKRLVSLDSEDTTSVNLYENFNALQKECNRLTEYCIKLEHERDEARKKTEQEVERIKTVLYKSIAQLEQIKPQTDD